MAVTWVHKECLNYVVSRHQLIHRHWALRRLRKRATLGNIRISKAQQPLAVESEYLAHMNHGQVARALRVGRTRARLSAVVVVRARHRHNLPVVRPQGSVTLKLIPSSAVPQHLRLVSVRVVRPVEVSVQHQLRVTRLTVYHLHWNMNMYYVSSWTESMNCRS